MLYPRFSSIPKTGTAFPKTGVLFLLCTEDVFLCKHRNVSAHQEGGLKFCLFFR